MPRKDVTFTYYCPCLFPANETFDLSSTLDSLSGKTPQDRVQRYNGDLIQLAKISQKNAIWELQFARYRHGMVPELGNPITVEFSPITLPPGYQLTEVISVLYDPSPGLNVLFIQQNKNAMNSTAIANYFTNFLDFGIPDPQEVINQAPQQLNLELILKPDAFEDIRRLGSIKRFTAQIQNSYDPEITAALEDQALGQVLRAATNYAEDLPIVIDFEVRIKARAFDATIDHDAIINTLRPLANLADTNPNIKKLEVFGSEEEGERNHPINLSKYRLEDIKSFDIPRGTAIPHTQIIEYMTTRFFERREYLRRILNHD